MGRKRRDTDIYECRYEMDSAWCRPSALSPTRALMQAILVLAIKDLQQGGAARREALRYVLEGTDDYIYSFESICHFLGLSPAAIRTAITGDRSIHFERRRARYRSFEEEGGDYLCQGCP